ncbi:MAG: hypothetical protein CVT49_05130 [candidate division Zixibacteria bacterium HGW-Zixibacteria-1]|nr:MAG: hypothetical protein CVT49_05130 [candidate division Zixibacteria bacterium HGW-Zixibacteria-1]
MTLLRIHLIITAAVFIILAFAMTGYSQNCCAPAVPQQGVLGETVALPHTLEIGLHYEYLRSAGLYEGSDQIDDPNLTKAIWKRAILTLSYGIMPKLGVSAIIPYLWKEKDRYLPALETRYINETEGIGDITFFARYSPLARSFVNFRELSVGFGVKIPTGATDRQNYNFLLPEELQPGTGSWDYNLSLSYYQGFEPVDFYLSGTYLITTEYQDYKFGNQFSYLLSSNFHLLEWLDATASLSGSMRAKDQDNGEDNDQTGRHQLWLVPGVQAQVLPKSLRLQAYFEQPIYQHFEGTQLGSVYNLRLTAVYLLPFKKSEEN